MLTEARVDEMRAMLGAAFSNLKLRYREASRVGADESLRAAVNEEILCIGRLHASVVLELNMASVPSLNVQFAAKSLMGDLKGYADLLDNEFVELARTHNIGDDAAGAGMPSPIRGGSDAGSTNSHRPSNANVSTRENTAALLDKSRRGGELRSATTSVVGSGNGASSR